jgi:hypothetical protein
MLSAMNKTEALSLLAGTAALTVSQLVCRA